MPNRRRTVLLAVQPTSIASGGTLAAANARITLFPGDVLRDFQVRVSAGGPISVQANMTLISQYGTTGMKTDIKNWSGYTRSTGTIEEPFHWEGIYQIPTHFQQHPVSEVRLEFTAQNDSPSAEVLNISVIVERPQ